MNVIQSAILGIVQGLAEFLPISSSGHLILARAIMGITAAESETGPYLMLDILLHLGTLAAVFAVFWRDWLDLIRHPIKNRTLLLLFVASLPTLFVGLFLKDFVDQFFTGYFLGISFLITGIFLMIAEKMSSTGKGTSEVKMKNAIVMGVMQAVAILPGVSRSGSTLMGGMVSGLDRKKTAKFSFMMSAPAILGSFVVEGKDALEAGFFSQIAVVPTIVGVVAAAVCGFIAIKFMMRLIEKISLNYFTLYVCLVGLAVLMLQLAGCPALPAFQLPGM